MQKASPKDPHIEVLKVTPDIAEAWLTKNVSNRPVRRSSVYRYARDIAAGDWRMTGEAIKFDSKGNLIDGQHRLMACVEAGKPMISMVIYNLAPGVRDVVDTGKSRSARDALALRGEVNASNLSAALRILVNEKNGQSIRAGGHSVPTNTEILDAYEKHPKLGLYIPFPRAMPRGISTSMVGYVAYLGSVILNKKARVDAMINVLRSGVPDYDGDPMHRYRERIIANPELFTVGSAGRNAAFYTFKRCWNLFSRKESIDTLRISKEDVAIDGVDTKKL